MKMLKLTTTRLFKLPFYFLAVPAVLIIRLMAPWYLVRFGTLISPRIGHFAANTEIYLCERDAGINVPKKHHVDLFYFQSWPPVSNEQLARMWKRVLNIWPAWILNPIVRLNRLMPGSGQHEVGHNTQSDRDVFNLLDRFPPHLEFTDEEEKRGAEGLNRMGIPTGAPFVCLNVRDNAYLDAQMPGGDWSYHDYRDSDIQNYVMAAEELASRGYFVLRMGAIVRDSILTSNKRILDYATNGSRSDFMDIFLGAKCDFCISVGSGYGSVPVIFRRPMVYVNYIPIGILYTFSKNFLGIVKHHVSEDSGRELTLSQIFSANVELAGATSEFKDRRVKLLENTPEEILDVVIEMSDRLRGTWIPSEGDEDRQRRFWELYRLGNKHMVAYGQPMHGEFRARFGADYLRKNPDWLQ